MTLLNSRAFFLYCQEADREWRIKRLRTCSNQRTTADLKFCLIDCNTKLSAVCLTLFVGKLAFSSAFIPWSNRAASFVFSERVLSIWSVTL